MNVARLPSLLLLLTTVISILTLSSLAYADGSAPSHTQQTLDAMLAAPAEDALESMELPTTLGLWAEPQGRQSHENPFIDFSHFEIGGFAGFTAFSSAFKANPSWAVGVSARVPVPGIPGNWGIFAEAFVAYINRDLPFYYNNRSGTWIGAEVGGDYTFIRDNIWYLRAQAGILYAYWNKINALDNGVGGLAGIQAGFYWIKHNQNAVVTITPQLSYDGKNWIGIFTLGFSYDF